MRIFKKRWTSLACLVLLGSLVTFAVDDAESTESQRARSVTDAVVPVASSEARMRAQMLYELARGSLQIMHRDFFDDDNSLAIPSASLEEVFQEMEKRFGVTMKWLVVDADVLNVEHLPESDFEKLAVKALAAGNPDAETIDAGLYHFAGPIRLDARCLKCHVKRRTSNEERLAGLVITIPIAIESAP